MIDLQNVGTENDCLSELAREERRASILTLTIMLLGLLCFLGGCLLLYWG